MVETKENKQDQISLDDIVARIQFLNQAKSF